MLEGVYSTGLPDWRYYLCCGISEGLWIENNPNTTNFKDFGPIPTFQAFPELWRIGKIQAAVQTSGYRLGIGLLIAIVCGVPIGILLGRSRLFRELSNSPFQLIRMISPLSWEPIAVIVFVTWNGAIVFLISIAAVWPIVFATAAGLAKVDPAWFKVAKNLGAKPWHMVTEIILPAIMFDILTGVRSGTGCGVDCIGTCGVFRCHLWSWILYCRRTRDAVL